MGSYVPTRRLSWLRRYPSVPSCIQTQLAGRLDTSKMLKCCKVRRMYPEVKALGTFATFPRPRHSAHISRKNFFTLPKRQSVGPKDIHRMRGLSSIKPGLAGWRTLEKFPLVLPHFLVDDSPTESPSKNDVQDRRFPSLLIRRG